MGWLNGWRQRVKFTTDHADIGEDLSNFPILLHLSTSSGYNADDISFIFDDIGSDANRLKIAVTTSDGTTECYVEIEKWDHANEHAWLWVKAPTVKSLNDTEFYFYYDHLQEDNTTHVGDPESTPAMAVWDANFVMVQHMNDHDTSNIHDSTTNNHDGAKVGANEPIEDTGEIGKAQSFDGSNDYVSMADANDLDITDELTIEAYIKPTNANGSIIVKGRTTYQENYWFRLYGSTPLFWYGMEYNQAGTAITLNVFTHVVVTVKFSNGVTTTVVKYYYNGEYKGGGTWLWGSDGVGAPVANAEQLDLGKWWYWAGNIYFTGIIDEVRVSNKIRDVHWIKACYETERDHLLDWGLPQIGIFLEVSYITSTIDDKSITIKSFEQTTEMIIASWPRWQYDLDQYAAQFKKMTRGFGYGRTWHMECFEENVNYTDSIFYHLEQEHQRRGLTAIMVVNEKTGGEIHNITATVWIAKLSVKYADLGGSNVRRVSLDLVEWRRGLV